MKKLVSLIFIINIFLTNSFASEIKLEFQVGKEIITNFDIKKEVNYLTALNNSLLDLEKSQILEIATDSLIREKIKYIELKKYYEFQSEDEYLSQIYNNFIDRLKLENENEINDYFKKFNLTKEEILSKIQIETLWNQLIFEKYNSQVIIKKDWIRDKIKKLEQTKNIKEVNLSEIVFQIKDQNNLDQKLNEIKKSILKVGFENTANLYSISDSKSFGGKIGWINESSLSELIVSNIKDLKKDEISPPINIGSNYILLKINEIRKSKQKIDKKEEFKKLELLERDRQLNKFSMIYFNKVKINTNVKKF
jgi:peptidyl-prolyl cis-trans isomerase SurA